MVFFAGRGFHAARNVHAERKNFARLFDPLHLCRRLKVFEPAQHFLRAFLDDHQFAMFRADETFAGRVVEKRNERVIKTGDVQQAERLPVPAKLAPRCLLYTSKSFVRADSIFCLVAVAET